MNLKASFVILPLVSLALLISCKKENGKNPAEGKAKGVVYSEATVDTTSGTTVEDTLQKVDGVLFTMETFKEHTLGKLKKATKQQANEEYETYRENAERAVEYINKLEFRLLENYDSYYDQKKKAFVFPEPVNKHVDLIKNSDLEFWEVGEGFAEIRFKPYHYYNLFKGKVTEDYENYLRIEAKENTVLFAADAGLNISFKELGDYLLNWEKFLKAYPESALLEKARSHYQDYGYTYLMGMDNTPTFEFSDGKLYNDNRREFKRFIAQNPDSDFTRIVKAFLAKFDQKATFDELQQFARKELNIVIKEEPEGP